MPTDPKETAGYSRKPIVGLAGGIGAGKSVVASLLAELGAGVIDSDALSHEEINKPDVRDTLNRWWGPTVVSADGSVDRKVIGGMVFADPLQRHRLEALLHPRIAVRRSDLIEEMQRQPRIRLIVLDSPLLYEADLDLMCDAVIFVHADFETRAARAASVRGWTREDLRRREATQSPLEMKRARADYVVENDGDMEALRRSVREVFDRIMAPRRVPKSASG